MKHVADAAKLARKKTGDTQRRMAVRLGVTSIHISNIENGKAMPSLSLMKGYETISGLDLYVVQWSISGDCSRLPKPVQRPARKLQEAWRKELGV